MYKKNKKKTPNVDTSTLRFCRFCDPFEWKDRQGLVASQGLQCRSVYLKPPDKKTATLDSWYIGPELQTQSGLQGMEHHGWHHRADAVATTERWPWFRRAKKKTPNWFASDSELKEESGAESRRRFKCLRSKFRASALPLRSSIRRTLTVQSRKTSHVWCKQQPKE